MTLSYSEGPTEGALSIRRLMPLIRTQVAKRAACALLALSMATASTASKAAEVPLGAEASFAKAARTLLAIGALPTTRDKELLFIKSDPMQVTDAAVAADCGKMFGIPYTRDKRTKVAATYQVTVAPLGEARSNVTVKVSLDGYMDTNEGAPFFIDKTRDKNKALTCTSTGVLEAQFFERFDAR